MFSPLVDFLKDSIKDVLSSGTSMQQRYGEEMSKSEDPAWKLCLGYKSGKGGGMRHMPLLDIRDDVNSPWVLTSVQAEARGKPDASVDRNMALSVGDLDLCLKSKCRQIKALRCSVKMTQ